MKNCRPPIGSLVSPRLSGVTLYREDSQPIELLRHKSVSIVVSHEELPSTMFGVNWYNGYVKVLTSSGKVGWVFFEHVVQSGVVSC